MAGYGMLGSMPRGLNGLLMAEQMNQQRSQNQLGQLGGILSLQNNLRQQAMDEQTAPLKLQLLQQQVANSQNPQLERVDLGDSIGMLDKRTGAIVGRIPKGASPDATLREQGANLRHERPSGSALFGGQVSMRGQDLGAQTAARGQDITLRGQNMVDARSRESIAQGRIPTGYMPVPGGLAPIPGGPATAKAQSSDVERTSAGYAGRMGAAGQIMGELEQRGIGKPELDEAALSVLPVSGKMLSNIAMSPDRQKYRQAQEDWVRAKLRKESGAVIADEEMDREIRVYFPQIGDSQQVQQQKAEARARAEAGMVQAAGRASVPQQQNQQDRRQQPRRVVDY